MTEKKDRSGTTTVEDRYVGAAEALWESAMRHSRDGWRGRPDEWVAEVKAMRAEVRAAERERIAKLLEAAGRKQGAHYGGGLLLDFVAKLRADASSAKDDEHERCGHKRRGETYPETCLDCGVKLDPAKMLDDLLAQAGAHPYYRADLARAQKAEAERDALSIAWQRASGAFVDAGGLVPDEPADMEKCVQALAKERDEACAEVELLQKMCAENGALADRAGAARDRLLGGLDEAIRQRDEARTEVERLREALASGIAFVRDANQLMSADGILDEDDEAQANDWIASAQAALSSAPAAKASAVVYVVMREYDYEGGQLLETCATEEAAIRFVKEHGADYLESDPYRPSDNVLRFSTGSGSYDVIKCEVVS